MAPLATNRVRGSALAVRFGANAVKIENPFVLLFDGIGTAWKKFTGTGPGQQFARGLKKVNGWLQASPKSQQAAKPARSSSPSKPSPPVAKLQEFFRKFNPRKIMEMKNPFVWLFGQIAKGWRWFISTAFGKRVYQGLKRVNGWIQTKKKTGESPASKPASSSSKPAATSLPSPKPLTEQEKSELEALESSPFMAKLETMSVGELAQLSIQKKEALAQLEQSKSALEQAVADAHWAERQAQAKVQCLQLSKPNPVSADIRQRQKMLLRDEERFKAHAALKKSELEAAKRQLVELTSEIGQIEERAWAKRQLESPPVTL